MLCPLRHALMPDILDARGARPSSPHERGKESTVVIAKRPVFAIPKSSVSSCRASPKAHPAHRCPCLPLPGLTARSAHCACVRSLRWLRSIHASLCAFTHLGIDRGRRKSKGSCHQSSCGRKPKRHAPMQPAATRPRLLASRTPPICLKASGSTGMAGSVPCQNGTRDARVEARRMAAHSWRGVGRRALGGGGGGGGGGDSL